MGCRRKTDCGLCKSCRKAAASAIAVGAKTADAPAVGAATSPRRSQCSLRTCVMQLVDLDAEPSMDNSSTPLLLARKSAAAPSLAAHAEAPAFSVDHSFGEAGQTQFCPLEGCGKACADAASLRKHMHTHGEKQYVCQVEGCGKRFLDSSKLKRHSLKHTGERPYECPFEGCGKRFSLEFNLRSHMRSRTHTDELPFVCSFPGCDKRFAQKGNLKTHFNSHYSNNGPSDVGAAAALYDTLMSTGPPMPYGGMPDGKRARLDEAPAALDETPTTTPMPPTAMMTASLAPAPAPGFCTWMSSRCTRKDIHAGCTLQRLCSSCRSVGPCEGWQRSQLGTHMLMSCAACTLKDAPTAAAVPATAPTLELPTDDSTDHGAVADGAAADGAVADGAAADSAAAPPNGKKRIEWVVVVPPGVAPGDLLKVVNPNWPNGGPAKMQIRVPPGWEPGKKLRVRTP